MAKRWDRMTDEERFLDSAQRGMDSRREQGLPEVCDDPAILAKVARIVASGRDSAVAS